MFRVYIPAMLLFALAEPTAADGEFIRYAITQGGLLAVVLVLLWYIRQQHTATVDDKDRQINEKDNRLDVITTLVSNNTIAMTKSADAINTLARTVEKIEERREHR